MTGHEIVQATADAEFTVVWDNGRPEVGHCSNRKNTRWHCSCGESFGSEGSAAEHVRSQDTGTER